MWGNDSGIDYGTFPAMSPRDETFSFTHNNNKNKKFQKSSLKTFNNAKLHISKTALNNLYEKLHVLMSRLFTESETFFFLNPQFFSALTF